MCSQLDTPLKLEVYKNLHSKYSSDVSNFDFSKMSHDVINELSLKIVEHQLDNINFSPIEKKCILDSMRCGNTFDYSYQVECAGVIEVAEGSI